MAALFPLMDMIISAGPAVQDGAPRSPPPRGPAPANKPEVLPSHIYDMGVRIRGALLAAGKNDPGQFVHTYQPEVILLRHLVVAGTPTAADDASAAEPPPESIINFNSHPSREGQRHTWGNKNSDDLYSQASNEGAPDSPEEITQAPDSSLLLRNNQLSNDGPIPNFPR
jgi:hypothetical protein